MALQSEKTGGPSIQAADRPKGHEDMYLCAALVVLLAWALYVGLGSVNWTAVSHTVRGLLAVVA